MSAVPGHTRCEGCGKVSFVSRKDARRGARRAVDGERPRAYRCPTSPYWHLGHLPEDVRRGVIDREEYVEKLDGRRTPGATGGAP
ncbi:hypothetical protein AB0M54_24430 [Actinoplanes sp. NPDC051470]|uniref:hypothetical protein n=1 Tax=Actinoplanes sp. NPDC051470 TaxID=3157224 RepID=UPI003413D790